MRPRLKRGRISPLLTGRKAGRRMDWGKKHKGIRTGGSDEKGGQGPLWTGGRDPTKKKPRLLQQVKKGETGDGVAEKGGSDGF